MKSLFEEVYRFRIVKPILQWLIFQLLTIPYCTVHSILRDLYVTHRNKGTWFPLADCSDLGTGDTTVTITTSEDSDYGSVATYQCKDGYSTTDTPLQRTCTLPDGASSPSWSDSAPICYGIFHILTITVEFSITFDRCLLLR